MVIGKARAALPTATGRGFTLIELLVVLALVALLVTIASPRYFGSLERSKEAVLRENLKVLRTTIDKYRADTGRYPETLEDLVATEYLRAVPVDPITESAGTWVFLPHKDSAVPGIFDIKSGAPGRSKGGIPYGEM